MYVIFDQRMSSLNHIILCQLLFEQTLWTHMLRPSAMKLPTALNGWKLPPRRRAGDPGKGIARTWNGF